MTIALIDIPAEIAESIHVDSAKTWTRGNEVRTYLTLHGLNRSFASDKASKVFWDHRRGYLVIERGRGTISDSFYASMTGLADATGTKIARV